MNTLKRFIEVVAVVTLLAGSAIHSRAATTVISALPAVTAAGSNDLLIVDTSNGPSSYTTHNLTQAQFFARLYGNALGGGITNLDASVYNVKDYGSVFGNAWAAFTNGDGTLYVPDGALNITTGVLMGQANAGLGEDTPFTLQGRGVGASQLRWQGNNGVLISDTAVPFGPLAALNLADVDLFNAGTGTNDGFLESPGGNKSFWIRNVKFTDWLVGLQVSQSGGTFDNLQLYGNAVGLWLPRQSDANIVNVPFTMGSTNADIYDDSSANQIFLGSAASQIGVLADRGGGTSVSGGAEQISNAVVVYGDPPGLPAWFTNNANAAGMQGMDLHDMYVVGGVSNTASFGNPAVEKIFNDSLGWQFFRNMPVSSGGVLNGVAIFTNADATPMDFLGLTGLTGNLVVYSDGSVVPVTFAGNSHITVNAGEADYTKTQLEFLRDTNGDVLINGVLTNGGGISPYSGQTVTILGATGGNNYGLQIGATGESGPGKPFNEQVATYAWPTTTALPAFVFDGPQYWEGFGPNDTSTGFMRLGPATAPFNGSSSAWVIFGSHAQSGLVVDAPAGVGLNVAQTSVSHSLDVNGTTAAQFRQGIATTGTAVGPMAASGYTNATGTNIICIGNFNATACTYVLRDASGAAWLTNTGNASPFFVPLQAGGSMTLTAGSISIGYWHVQ